jgi:RluA family pseudouridine synthase
MKLKLIATREHASKRLNEALAEWLTSELGRPVSKAKARKIIIAGAVYLNKRRVIIPSQALSTGAAIEAHVDISKLFDDSASRDKEFELTADRILFEDDDLIFIDKPPELPMHPTADGTRDNLFAVVGRFLGKRQGTEKPYLGVHHRLDRDTSGVVFFTKSSRVNAAVAKSFSGHQVIKTYQAITISGRTLKPEWTVTNYLGKASTKSRRTRYLAVRSDGDFAETFFRVIAVHTRGVWVEAIPKTGRTHQIRVHLSEYGLPILGDDLYGAGPEAGAPRLMLHAVRLVLPHPITGRAISIESPLPADFKRCLKSIE